MHAVRGRESANLGGTAGFSPVPFFGTGLFFCVEEEKMKYMKRWRERQEMETGRKRFRRLSAY
jgi:hypothetical protein